MGEPTVRHLKRWRFQPVRHHERWWLSECAEEDETRGGISDAAENEHSAFRITDDSNAAVPPHRLSPRPAFRWTAGSRESRSRACMPQI
jgi:hypothetical protein